MSKLELSSPEGRANWNWATLSHEWLKVRIQVAGYKFLQRRVNALINEAQDKAEDCRPNYVAENGYIPATTVDDGADDLSKELLIEDKVNMVVAKLFRAGHKIAVVRSNNEGSLEVVCRGIAVVTALGFKEVERIHVVRRAVPPEDGERYTGQHIVPNRVRNYIEVVTSAAAPPIEREALAPRL